MSKKLPKIWTAEPHTLAKIQILRSYLSAWFPILGSRFAGRDLWYIDGFSGPGEYTNAADGSPIAALKVAEAAREKTRAWIAGDVRCLFVEEDEARHEHLASRIRQTNVGPHVHAEAFLGTFAAGLSNLKARALSPFARVDPVFAFVDPFGAKGLSFVAIEELLRMPRGEVLLNLDSDGISRIYHAGDHANHRELLDDVFGDREWEREFSQIEGDVPRSIVAMYKRRLKSLSGVRYVFAFEMRSGPSSIEYHLVFASRHPLGLQKMKEAMKKLDQDGTYSFCSSNIGQQCLFRFDEPGVAARELALQFVGRTITYGEVHEYALTESPFTNPKSMLKLLELDGRITVKCTGADRRKGTFPDRFHGCLLISFGENTRG